MAAGPRHSDPPATPAPQIDYYIHIAPSHIRAEYYAAYVRPSLAKRLVHRLLRKPPPPGSAKRGQLGPVADQRDRSPVG